MSSTPTPQFGTAEYSSAPGPNVCKSCGQPIVGQYYRVNNALTCSICGKQAMSLGSQDSKKSFAGGLLVGIGGAILGLILFAAVGIIFELQIGFVSLAVGWIVGRAVLLGSGNVGGRRYQIMAALLTYAAVSMSVIPLVVWNVATGDAKVESKDAKNAEPSGAQPGADSSNPADGTKESADSASASSAVVAVIGILGYLAVIGLASPFLELAEPVSGIIGLVILFVGIRIAWQMTAGAGIAVRGPYNA